MSKKKNLDGTSPDTEVFPSTCGQNFQPRQEKSEVDFLQIPSDTENQEDHYGKATKDRNTNFDQEGTAVKFGGA